MENEYYFGLDIGSNSVGYAVTDMNYEILKFKNKAMWGSHVFEEGKQCAERRFFRSARRRLDRKKQRILLARELFAKEIAKIDKDFFIRLDESALLQKDKTLENEYSLFNDPDFKDKDYYETFPTIHHLIMHLIESEKKQDIRLIYLAVSYMLVHRGHFLIEVDKEEIGRVVSFDIVYDSFRSYFIKNEIDTNWSNDIKEELGTILKQKIGIAEKQKLIKMLLFKDTKPVKSEEAIIKGICGGKIKLSDLYNNDAYNELDCNNLSLSDGDLEDKFIALNNMIDENEFDLIVRMKAIYDWSLLVDILMGERFLSQGMVTIYEKHKQDLTLLKRLVKEYLPDYYNEIFLFSKKGLDNYTAYSGNFKSATNYKKGEKKKEPLAFVKTDNEKFSAYIKKLIGKIQIAEKDIEIFNDMKTRLNLRNAFMPKQVSKNNGAIPFQIVRYQLKALLEKVSKHHPFLLKKDETGLTIIDKLLSIIEFRIPYYVGPLNTAHGKYTWITRKSQGRILPWNFEEKVDLEKSEEAFIRRMTRKCTYLAGEDTLCKNSLLYMKYMVLNEINNIKIDENPITVECKQKLFNDLFIKNNKIVTKKKIKEWLLSNNYMNDTQEIRGVDDDIKTSLRSYHEFKAYFLNGSLDESEAEDIIARISITNDKKRLSNYLKSKFNRLKEEDIKRISNINYSDYGRLSNKLLTGVLAVMPGLGETTNIINALWDTNYNLMQLLSQNFGFLKKIEGYNEEYFSDNQISIDTMLEDMYISNAVKRPIYRTLDIVNEIKGIMGKSPKRIFIEMARSEGEKKRTKSRKTQLMELYDNLGEEYKKEWKEKLEREAEEKLKSEKLYLYYVQLGKCMYTGKDMNINQLMDKTYDIDHIYPQSRVKDDSVHNNKVLVDSGANRLKGDRYPLPIEYQKNMNNYWQMLSERKLVNREKFYRLTRITSFKDEELVGFINRQIVETRQSTKAIARLLENLFPQSEIVYVKAGLVSEFRQQFELPKSRGINDLHHAKDAYLNIIMGNVYNTKFTKNPLNFIKSGEKYSINIKDKKGLLSKDIERNGVVAWKGDGTTIAIVKNTISKNNINYTKFSFCRKGSFFDQNPQKATLTESSLVNRKKDLSSKFYGGYGNTTASFFTLIKYSINDKVVISIKPVELLYAKRFIEDEVFARDYCKYYLGIENPKILQQKRVIKINTILCLDGFKTNIASKSNLGKTLVLASAIPLVLSASNEKYIKRIEAVDMKVKKAIKEKQNYTINDLYDKVSKTENEKLYNDLTDKCQANIFSKVATFTKIHKLLKSGIEQFQELTIDKQIKVLLEIIRIFNTGRTTGCDLREIGGSKAGGVITINSDLTSTKYRRIEIVDQSATGLFTKSSGNLLEL